jgi:hypothetical protein
VNLKHALECAGRCVHLAEDATDLPSREYYLILAKRWLSRADVDAWYEGIMPPAVILALEERPKEHKDR